MVAAGDRPRSRTAMGDDITHTALENRGCAALGKMVCARLSIRWVHGVKVKVRSRCWSLGLLR
ncbi:hypothetical protein AMTR_s00027p00242120 [Amborella trichopoda]|uniref:Uncharacterized protein n=1 Tax=Amborella trichopoda TaxID=13333 RepID=W1PLF4_AMBTC|nr:hypothetical protein AMTR_s00027p00242120 [Amborella trichopoda]